MNRFLRSAPVLLFGLLAGPAPARVLEAPSATYPTLQDALTAAVSGDIVRVKRGAYSAEVELKSGVTLEGEETAGTTLRGIVTWANGAILRRVTLNGAGLTLTAVTEGTIENCIFRGTTGTGTALTLTNCRLGSGPPGSLRISRNTFFDNGTALKASGTNEVAAVSLNMFANNGLAVEVPSDSTASPTISGNNFWSNDADGALGGAPTLHDPLFLDEAGNPPDLHTTTDSEARDVGAYSGDGADPTPAPPEGVTALLRADGRTVDLTWDSNRAYNVSVESYGLYLSRTKDGDGRNLETVPAESPEEPLTYSEALDVGPQVPTGVRAAPRDGALKISWNKDDRADGYAVRIGTTSGGVDGAPQDVGDVSEYTRDGLSNGTVYYVSVQAQSEAGDRYLSVTATASEGDPKPESRGAEAAKVTLTDLESAFSAEVSATPAPIDGFPSLDDNGACFLGALTGRGPSEVAGGRGLTLLGAAAALALLASRRRRQLAAAVATSLLFATSSAQASEPRWVATAAAGLFEPDQEGWDDAYDDPRVFTGKVGLGYRFLRQLEVGADAGYWRAKGDVRETSDGHPLEPSLEQTLEVIPLQAYLLVNLHFRDHQWVVPYLAGGYSYLLYRHEVDDGDTVQGHSHGAHGRVGLKAYLNPWEPEAAEKARGGYGVKRSYLFVEVQVLDADPSGEADLSGLSYFGGVSVEF